MRRMVALFLVLGSGCLYAHKHPIDSHDLAPPETAPAKSHGFVLTSGGYTIQCQFGYRAGCERVISSKVCPPQYEPRITTSIASGGSGCGIQHINLFPQQGILSTKQDGYHLSFIQAYVSTSRFCGSILPLTINYSVYCT